MLRLFKSEQKYEQQLYLDKLTVNKNENTGFSV